MVPTDLLDTGLLQTLKMQNRTKPVSINAIKGRPIQWSVPVLVEA